MSQWDTMYGNARWPRWPLKILKYRSLFNVVFTGMNVCSPNNKRGDVAMANDVWKSKMAAKVVTTIMKMIKITQQCTIQYFVKLILYYVQLYSESYNTAMMRSNPQPAQSVALSATENKHKRKTHEATTKHWLLVTGIASTPLNIVKVIAMEKRYIETSYKEVDAIIPRQVVDAAAQGAKWIKVFCDDKDVFNLLIYYLPTNRAYCYATVLMEGTSRTRDVIDIGTTARQQLQIYHASSLQLTLLRGVILSL